MKYLLAIAGLMAVATTSALAAIGLPMGAYVDVKKAGWTGSTVAPDQPVKYVVSWGLSRERPTKKLVAKMILPQQIIRKSSLKVYHLPRGAKLAGKPTVTNTRAGATVTVTVNNFPAVPDRHIAFNFTLTANGAVATSATGPVCNRYIERVDGKRVELTKFVAIPCGEVPAGAG